VCARYANPLDGAHRHEGGAPDLGDGPESVTRSAAASIIVVLYLTVKISLGNVPVVKDRQVRQWGGEGR
jgi:hypothetical protein